MKKLFFIFILFLLVISCGNEEENSTTENGLVIQKSVEMNNLNNIKTRIANSVLKFRQKEQYFVGKNPKLGFLINFKDEKLNLLFEKNKKQLTQAQIRYIIAKTFQKVGIKVTPHQLRHSFATYLLNNGARINDVSELLGHEFISTTQIYTKLNDNMKYENYKKAHPLCQS